MSLLQLDHALPAPDITSPICTSPKLHMTYPHITWHHSTFAIPNHIHLYLTTTSLGIALPYFTELRDTLTDHIDINTFYFLYNTISDRSKQYASVTTILFLRFFTTLHLTIPLHKLSTYYTIL